MPAERYEADAQSASAAAHSSFRSTSSTNGEGLSSTTFWWRRCTLQSRSPNAFTTPLPSPTTCRATVHVISRTGSEGYNVLSWYKGYTP